MSAKTPTQTVVETQAAPPQPAARGPQPALGRQCAGGCGAHTVCGAVCDDCRRQRPAAPTLARAAVNHLPGPAAPSASDAPAPRDATPASPAASSERNFAEVRTSLGAITIRDTDPARAEATRRLLQELASRLGLGGERLEVRVDAEAERRTSARGAGGLAEGRAVYLNPRRYDPARFEGRYLLGHELVHVAQRARGAGAEAADARAALTGAEIEARFVGEALAAGRDFAPVAGALAAGVAAADIGANSSDAAVVAVSRERELARIRTLLALRTRKFGERQIIPHENVREVLNILSLLPFSTARALVSALSPEERLNFVFNLAPARYQSHRTQILAAYAALDPAEFKHFDEDLLEEMDLALLTAEEHEAVIYTLRNLDEQSRQDLLSSGNRDAVGSLMLSPALDPEQREKLRRRELEARHQERERAAELARGARTFQVDDRLKGILREVTNLLDSFIVTDAKARRALALIKSAGDEWHIRYLAEQLEANGKLDVLIEELPEEARYEDLPTDARDTDTSPNTFLLLLKYRSPEKNFALAIDLLSYGLFDWAVRDAEARLAYHLIKQMPPHAQDRFRRLDRGKWYTRLEENINPALKGREYTGIEVREEDGRLVDVTAEYAKKIRNDDPSLRELLDLCEKGINKKTAPLILQRILAFGRADLGRDADPALLQAVARRLDMFGYIDELFDELETEALLKEEQRMPVLRLMLARDPFHVQRHARDLVRRTTVPIIGLSLTVVTAREAFLAYQLVRALPDEEREAFVRRDGGVLWKDILGEMTSQMRTSKDLNAFVERDGGLQRSTVLVQLTEPATWTTKNASRLDGLIRMAVAMGEHKWVFGESERKYALVTDADVKRLYEKYALYDPDKRPAYSPADLRGTKWYQEGAFQTITTLAKGLVFIDDLFLLTRSVGVSRLDLEELQDVLGGDLSGVKLARAAAGAEPPPTAGSKEAADAERATEEANRVSLAWDIRQGALKLDLPELRIAAINFHGAGSNIQTGAVTLRGLEVSGQFSTSSHPGPNSLSLKIADLDLADALLVGRDWMVAVNRLGLKTLLMQGGVTDAETRQKPEPRGGHYLSVPLGDGYLRIPIVSRLVGLVYHIFKFKGWLTKSATEEVREGIETMQSLQLKFGSLTVSGVNINGSDHVETFEIRDFDLRVGGTRPTYLRHLIPHLRRRIELRTAAAAQLREGAGPREKIERAEADVADLKGQLEKAQAELKDLLPKEEEFLRLQRQQQADPDEFPPADKSRLARLREEMKGGVVLDIGGVSAKGISGRVNTASITLSDLHGAGVMSEAGMEAVGALVGPGIVSNPTIARRFMENSDPKVLKERLDDAAFRIEVGEIKSDRITFAAGIPTVKQLEEERKKVTPLKDQKEEHAVAYRQLTAKLEDVRRYERYVGRDIESLTDWELEDFRGLRAKLTGEVLANVGPVEFEGGFVDVDLARGRAALGGRRVGVGGLELPAQGIAAESIEARDFSVGVSVPQGLAGLTGIPKNIRGLDVSATELKARGVRLSLPEKYLRDALDWYESRGADTLTEKEKARVEKIRVHLLEVEDIQGRLRDAEAAVGAAANEAERAEATKSVEFFSQMLENWQAKVSAEEVSLADLNVAVGGAAGLFGGPKQPLTVEGTGPEGRMVSGFGAKGVTLRDPLDKTRSTEIREVVGGPVSGKVTYDSEANTVKIENFVIDSVTVSGLVYNSPTAQVWLRDEASSCTLTTVTLTATIALSADAPAKKEGDKGKPEPEPARKMTVVDIHNFGIESIAAKGLVYYHVGKHLQVDVDSGSLNKIFAENLRLTLPDEGETKLTGFGPPAKEGGKPAGKFGFDGMALAVRAGMLSGLRANGRLNAQTLRVGVADDGAMSVDLASLAADANLSDEGLRLGVNLKARGIRAHISPGFKRISGGFESASIGAKGKIGGAAFDASAENISTKGKDIVYTADGVEIPCLNIESVILRDLDFDSPEIRLYTYGERAVASNIDVTMKVEFNRPAGNRLKAEKPQSAIKRIVISRFHITDINTRGIYFEIKDVFHLSLPAEEIGLISDVDLLPETEGGEGFVIQPGEGKGSWEILGQLGVGGIDLVKAEAGLVGLLSASADFYARSLRVGFLKGGDKTIDIEKISLTNLAGEVQDSKFTFSMKTKHVDPGIDVLGAHLRLGKEDGKTVVKEAGISGLNIRGFRWDYPGKGLWVDIHAANLPEGFGYERGGPVIVPDLKITEAFIHIEDVMALAGGGGSSGGSSFKPKDLNFLDTLNGTLNFDLKLPLDVYQYGQHIDVGAIQDTFPIRMFIQDGKINFAKLEDTALGNTLDNILDFEIKDDKLILQLDLQTLTTMAGTLFGAAWGLPGLIIGGGVGLIGGAFAKIELVKWTLPTSVIQRSTPTGVTVEMSELEQAAGSDKVKITRLINPDKDPSKDPDAPSPLHIRWSQMELLNFNNTSLSLLGQSTIDFGEMGRINLGGEHRDAMRNLTVKGSSTDKGGLELGMDQFNLSVSDLKLGDATLNTGIISVKHLSRANLTFKRGMPKTFEGTIGEATAHNIVVDLPEPVGRKKKK